MTPSIPQVVKYSHRILSTTLVVNNCTFYCCGCQEKVDALEVLGADVRLVPAVPFTDPKNYNHQVLRKYSTKLHHKKWILKF